MLKNIILYIHQLPQNLIGLFILIYNKYFCKHKSDFNESNLDGIIYYKVKHINDCGISLGKYIFLDVDSEITDNDIRHEYGHCKQSLYLGWLYLFVIGIPSALHNVKHSYKRNCDYYHFYTEKWADKLGNVTR